jgi:hypothetical protein
MFGRMAEYDFWLETGRKGVARSSAGGELRNRNDCWSEVREMGIREGLWSAEGNYNLLLEVERDGQGSVKRSSSQ